MLHFPLKEQQHGWMHWGGQRGGEKNGCLTALRSLKQRLLTLYRQVNHGERKWEGLGMEKYRISVQKSISDPKIRL